MPAAANLLKTIVGDTAPAAAPRPGGEAFAIMLSGEEIASPEDPGATGPDTPEAEASPQPPLDLIAPLLAQQRIVPTVIVPQGGASEVTVPAMDQADPIAPATADGASATLYPLVPNGSAPPPAAVAVSGLVQTTGLVEANSKAVASTTGREVAPRHRSGAADSTGARPIELSENVQGSAPTPSRNAETVSALDTSPDQFPAAMVPGQLQAQAHAKTPDRSTQAEPAAAAVMLAPTESAANEHQSGNGERQSETAAPAADIRPPPGATSFGLTDARSLLASLTANTGLVTAAPAQAGAAQQLGEALAAQVLNLAGGSEWLEQLTQEIGRTADGSGPLRFRLTPESLGELRVEISQSDRGAIVRMSVTTEAAQAALSDAQPRLTAEARAQGVRIAETQVDLAGSQQQQEREASRQRAGDHPLRAFRATASSPNPTEPARSRPADRYA